MQLSRGKKSFRTEGLHAACVPHPRMHDSLYILAIYFVEVKGQTSSACPVEGKHRKSCVPVSIRGRSYPPRTIRKVYLSSMTNVNTRWPFTLTAKSGSKSHGDIVQGRCEGRIAVGGDS